MLIAVLRTSIQNQLKQSIPQLIRRMREHSEAGLSALKCDDCTFLEHFPKLEFNRLNQRAHTAQTPFLSEEQKQRERWDYRSFI